MIDYDDPPPFDGPRVSTTLNITPGPCRTCDATGLVSGPHGRARFCPRCHGTAITRPTQGYSARISWGVRRG